MTPARATKMIRESEIEAYLVRAVKAQGGVCLKFVSPGTVGAPDRIVILEGQVAFVEVKAPGKLPGPAQLAFAKRLLNAGAQWTFVDSRDSVEAFVRGLG